MIAIGFGLVWLSYSIGLYGYTLIRGYDITPKDLYKVGPYRGHWPPPAASNTDILPTGKGNQGATGSGGGAQPVSAPGPQGGYQLIPTAPRGAPSSTVEA